MGEAPGGGLPGADGVPPGPVLLVGVPAVVDAVDLRADPGGGGHQGGQALLRGVGHEGVHVVVEDDGRGRGSRCRALTQGPAVGGEPGDGALPAGVGQDEGGGGGDDLLAGAEGTHPAVLEVGGPVDGEPQDVAAPGELHGPGPVVLHLPGQGLPGSRVGDHAHRLPPAGGPAALGAQAQGVAGGLPVGGGPDVHQLGPQALVAPALLGHPGRGGGHEVEVVQAGARQDGGGQDAQGGQVQGPGALVAHPGAHPQGGGGGAPQVGEGTQAGGLVVLGEEVVRPGAQGLLQADGAQGGALRGAGEPVVHEGPPGLQGQALHERQVRDVARTAAERERRGLVGLGAQPARAQGAGGGRRGGRGRGGFHRGRRRRGRRYWGRRRGGHWSGRRGRRHLGSAGRRSGRGGRSHRSHGDLQDEVTHTGPLLKRCHLP